MRPLHISAILEKEFECVRAGFHTPVMMWGPPGVGKSQLVAQAAQRHGVPLLDIRLSQMEPSDLRGIPFRVDDSVEWAVPSILPDVKRHGDSGFLFLDEITSAPPSVSAAAYQLILDRRLGLYEIPDAWVVVAAGNRQGDRGVTYTMPAPLANRFSHFEVEIHLDDWVAWAFANKIDEHIIAFLRFRPELLFEFDPSQNPVAFPSPRSWEYTHRALQKFIDNPQLLLGSLHACVGQAAGLELHAFIENMDQLPDIEAILRGEDIPVPSEIDLQYAVACALVGKAIQSKNSESENQVIGSILDYALKFPAREMGVMLVSDMVRAVGDRVYSVEQFSRWADSAADVMIYS